MTHLNIEIEILFDVAFNEEIEIGLRCLAYSSILRQLSSMYQRQPIFLSPRSKQGGFFLAGKQYER